ncbi:DUF3617 domain-containing protein [Pseudoduganella sp. GCM10020061]|uniref:DUF3617 domain-containing protein n=1 Tax=Pseudoduganella sp. GCM10020061 TaxID=3317345 RepID=UPI00363B1004
MNVRHACFGIILMAATAATCSAQTMKPGLWDVNTTMKSPDGEMQKAMTDMQAAMAAMPPDQRKAMEDMMAKQGVKIGAGSGGALNTKVCMSKEMVERNVLPVNNRGNCSEKRGPLVNGRMKASFTCTNPPSSGDAEFAFSGDSAFTMKMNTTSTVAGKTEKMAMESSGRWLGADCGSIRPLSIPKSK